ncbi:MAG: nucleotidyl transferase AbiEii/AbiGii toxin family protein [Patescibacteria group bacterium]
MISFEEIKKHYNEQENQLPRAILKEYLQYKILEIIFSSPFSNKIIFMGGTSLRIIYGSDRFSEDLDLDNQGLNKKDFTKLMSIIKTEFKKEGINTEIRNVFKGVYRCYLKFPKILFANNLSPLAEEKILIQIDSYKMNKNIKPIIRVVNKVDVFTEIRVYSPDILLAQKIFALLNRKRAKGRDIYDIVYLFSLTQPNWDLLKKYTKIDNLKSLKAKLSTTFSLTELKTLAKDVEPFLINPKKIIQIEKFNQWLNQ